jgi:hypothetical protein
MAVTIPLLYKAVPCDGEKGSRCERHSGLLSEEAKTQHADGWTHYLKRLSGAAAGNYPGPDPWVQTPPDHETVLVWPRANN